MKKSKQFFILLLLISCFGFFLRTYNINWDEGHNIHPDERAIFMITAPLALPATVAEFFSPDSPLNPHFFAYGNLPLYLLKAVSSLAGLIHPQYASYDYYWLIGRILNALVDSATILIIGLLTYTLTRSRQIAVLSSFLYSVAVLPIQTSHFYVVDLILTFFIILILYLLTFFLKKPTIKNSIGIGILFGSALATKTSALPLLLPIGIACLFANQQKIQSHSITKKCIRYTIRFAKTLATYGVIIGICTIISFVLLEPYAFIDSEKFLQNQQEQSQMTTNPFAFPYTFQYIGKVPYLYELSNIYWWGLGPVISASAVAGIILLLSFTPKKNMIRKKDTLLVTVFSVVYFGIVGGFAVGWMRYMLPLYPIICIFSAFFIYHVGKVVYELTAQKIHHVTLQRIVLCVFIIVTSCAILYWPISFMTIYTDTHTRITASEWILNNIPKNSVIATEHWDDQLPLKMAHEYQYAELPMYEPDTNEKWSVIQERLNSSGYLILASNRLYTPLMKLIDCEILPEGRCYTRSAQYYQQLLSGNHQFKLIKEFQVYPTIPFLNIPIDDQSADESFTVYDHPKVLIFKKQIDTN